MPASTKKVYVKDYSYVQFNKKWNRKFLAKTHLVPMSLILVGALVLTSQVILPLIYFKTNDETTDKSSRGSVLGVATGFSDFQFKELPDNLNMEIKDVPESFLLSIPKLKIVDAKVETNPKNLNPDEALGRYIGSALPGEVGNVFIYGHSVLPFFYNPKNYKTIFSTLDQLNVGDEFEVKYDGKIYTYKVETRNILKPDLINPLAETKPKYLNEQTVSLMTCYPAGTREKRLIINAIRVND